MRGRAGGSRRGATARALGVVFALLACGPAAAQTLAASVNGSPITTFDIDERVKLRKVLRETAAPDAALEELIGERIRFREANRFGGDATETDLARELTKIAARLNMQPGPMLDALRKAGVSEEHLRGSLRTRAAWQNYVKARQKGLEASEREVRAEIARRAGRYAVSVDYVVREIIVVIPGGATPARQAARLKDAETLRARFADCINGPALTGAMQDVVVRRVQTRNSASLSPALRAMLEATPEGHLTPPQRGASGIEMIALCDRRASRDDSALREEVQAEILSGKLQAAGERYYQDLRRAAVIVRR